MTGRHTNIRLSFLLVSHTKIAPDWCFELFKRLVKKTRVSSLKFKKKVVQKSGICNETQQVTDESGRVILPTLDWITFLTHMFKKLPGSKKTHYFPFSSFHKGFVMLNCTL